MDVVREADIAAPPQKVYEYLVDFPRHSEWTTPGHGVRITAAVPGPAAVGSSFNSVAHQFGSQQDRISVTELTPNSRIVYEATMKDGSLFRHTFTMEPSGSGTHLTKRFQSVRLSLPMKLFSPMGSLMAPKTVTGDLERIKARLEQSAG